MQAKFLFVYKTGVNEQLADLWVRILEAEGGPHLLFKVNGNPYLSLARGTTDILLRLQPVSGGLTTDSIVDNNWGPRLAAIHGRSYQQPLNPSTTLILTISRPTRPKGSFSAFAQGLLSQPRSRLDHSSQVHGICVRWITTRHLSTSNLLATLPIGSVIAKSNQ